MKTVFALSEPWNILSDLLVFCRSLRSEAESVFASSYSLCTTMFLYKSSASCWRRRRERERNVLACVWIKRICCANFCLSSCPLISRLDERQAAAPSEVSLRTSGWSDGLGGSNWVRAAGFSLQQSHSLPGGRSHASMLFITPNKQQGRKTNQGGNRRTTAARGGLIISWYFFSLRLCVLCFEAGINRIEQNRITLMIPDWDLRTQREISRDFSGFWV